MLRTSESDETEILLGNKQLLGIFFVVALLLAVAFYGGYMVGRGGNARKSASPPAVAQEETPAKQSSGGGETHVVSGGRAQGPIRVRVPSVLWQVRRGEQAPIPSHGTQNPPARLPAKASRHRLGSNFYRWQR